MDDKAAAAYHPFKSAEEMHEALKPRDEIAQAQVGGRETVLGVDLNALPVKKLRDLAQGNLVLHEGIWVKIDEYQVNDQHNCIRLKFIRPNDQSGSTWARHLIASMDELFYVPEEVKDRSFTKYTRSELTEPLVRRVPPKA